LPSAGPLLVVRMAQIHYRILIAAGLLALVSLIPGLQVSWCQTEKELRGLPNFGRVTDNLYRGGQPTLDGFSSLRAMGVGMVVNFRDERAETEIEKRQVESLGIKYVGIPFSANHKPPTNQIVEFLDLLRANPSTKIFVHCRRGADRTGLMIAAYRVSIEHQPVTDAVSEMHRFHYDWLFRPQLKRYIDSLPELLQTDPQYARYRSQASGAR